MHKFSLSAVVTLLAFVALASCGGDTGSGPRQPAVPSAAQSPTPQSVSPELWLQLTAELERVLAETGRDKTTSSPTTGAGSAVSNLSAFYNTLQQQVYFSYANQGDYDLNGIVTIADLTPIGIHFGKTSLSSDWVSAQLADGDRNGIISIADVTPIGQNFGGRVDGFELQLQQLGDFALLEDFALASFTESNTYPYIRSNINVGGAGRLRVVPYTDEGENRAYGPPSNVVQAPLLLAPNVSHRQYAVDAARSGNTGADFPEGASFSWNLPLGPGEIFNSDNIVVSATGMIYFGTTIVDDHDQPVDGYMYAVTQVGELLWRVRVPNGIATAGAITMPGDIIVCTPLGTVISFSGAGHTNWTYESGLYVNPHGNPLLRADDSTVLLGTVPSTDESVVFALSAQGELLWEFDALFPLSSPATQLSDDGMLGIAGSNADLLFLTEDGQGAPSPILDIGSPHMIVRGEGRVFIPSSFGKIYSFVPPAGVPAIYDPGEDLTQTTAFDRTNDRYFFASYKDGVGRLTAMSPSLVYIWDVTFTSQAYGLVTVDRNGDVLVPVSSSTGGDTGLWCVGADETFKWFYDTAGNYTGSPVPCGDGLLLISLQDIDTGASQLVAIGTAL